MIVIQEGGVLYGVWRNEDSADAFRAEHPEIPAHAIHHYPQLSFPFYIVEKTDGLAFFQDHWDVEKELKAIKMDIDCDLYFNLYLIDKEYNREVTPSVDLKLFPVTNYVVRGFRKKGWEWFLTPAVEEIR